MNHKLMLIGFEKFMDSFRLRFKESRYESWSMFCIPLYNQMPPLQFLQLRLPIDVLRDFNARVGLHNRTDKPVIQLMLEEEENNK